MNRITSLFQQNPSHLLSVYFCAGAPTLDGTLPTLLALQRRGIQMVEVGIPFSDPLADGPVIQDAATTALRKGMTLRKLFEQLRDLRPQIHIPVILMGYLNPIYHYGVEAFFQSCQACGVDGVIIPDLPFDDYLKDVKPIADCFDVKVIMLITPETSEERIRQIDQHTSGFIYMVSTAATTGAQSCYAESTLAYFKRIKTMQLRNPLMVGFGISNRATLSAAQNAAAGAIVGSCFVSLLKKHQDPDRSVEALLETLAR